MSELPYELERTVLIRADRETVFRFFTDSARWATWWGAGSTIDAQPGGKVFIRHPNGIEVVGEVVEAAAPERIVFTYGFVSGKPMGPGESRVTISLRPDPTGTRLHLRHAFKEEGPCNEHVQGWRFQLSLFSNAVATEAFAGAAGVIDAWYEAWTIADEKERRQAFANVVAPDIRFRDRYSLLDGMEDLVAHVGAALRFMPGIKLARKGEVRQCQGTAVTDWVATDAQGTERMAGTSVCEFGPGGKLLSVTGIAK
jgi:uncharacterized protein YndB with AHSA1/START domain